MPRRLRPRLVGTPDPSDIFSDLAALRQEQQTSGKPQRRQRAAETFARIPHDRALALYRMIGGPAWVLLVELDRIILRGRGRNPFKLSSARLERAGFHRHARLRALRQLEAAGMIKIERLGKGRIPWVLHSWFPRQD